MSLTEIKEHWKRIGCDDTSEGIHPRGGVQEALRDMSLEAQERLWLQLYLGVTFTKR